ncbi:hypothetical protein EDD36DRAFT_154036 [Exophiala viscosa]|uniref:Uncharacterized protein n=1 Tax=Exophiala viscosa TaxID=2486360 RepID=A0AAN6E4A3_9EURO|nr:hypothetical protein EDD36DRAFT_154036 [Exophiala viscosa]
MKSISFVKYPAQNTHSIQMPYLSLCRRQQPLWEIINLCLFACSRLTRLLTSQNSYLPYNYITNAALWGLVCYLDLPYLLTTALSITLQRLESLSQNTILHAFARCVLTESNFNNLGSAIFDYYVSPPVLDIIDPLINPNRTPTRTVKAASAGGMVLDIFPTSKPQNAVGNMVACVAREMFMLMLRWLFKGLVCCSSQEQEHPSDTQQQSTPINEGGNGDDQTSEQRESDDKGRQDSWDSGYGGSEQSANDAGNGNGGEEDGNGESGSQEEEDEEKEKDGDEDEHSDQDEESDEEKEEGSRDDKSEDREEEEEEEEEEENKTEDDAADVNAAVAAMPGDEVEEGNITLTTVDDHDHDIDGGEEEEEEDPEQPEQFRFVRYDALGRRNAWDFSNIPTIRDRNTAFLLRRAQRACRRGRE